MAYPRTLDTLPTGHVLGETLDPATDNAQAAAINALERRIGISESAAQDQPTANAVLTGKSATVTEYRPDVHIASLTNMNAAGGAIDVPLFRAPYPLQITALRGMRSGGTGAGINVRVNATNVLTADLSLTSADTEMSAGTINNPNVQAGDMVWARWTGFAGAPAWVHLQIDYVRTGA